MQTFNPDDPASTPTTLEQIIRPELLPADRPQQGTCDAEDFIVGGYNAYANLCGSPFPTSLFRQYQDQALLPLLAMHQPALYGLPKTGDPNHADDEHALLDMSAQ